jgi:hypothetical protein
MIEADRVLSTPPPNSSLSILRILIDAALIAIVMICAAVAGYIVGGL